MTGEWLKIYLPRPLFPPEAVTLQVSEAPVKPASPQHGKGTGPFLAPPNEALSFHLLPSRMEWLWSNHKNDSYKAEG